MDISLEDILIIIAIRDMKKILESKRCPKGQDHTRYMQVFEFLNTQRKNPGIRREDLALQIANAFRKGRSLATSIQQRERSWIRKRFIEPGYQGKTGKIRTMLEDEGTLIAIREWIALTNQKVTAQDLAKAVSDHWRQMAVLDEGIGSEGLDEEIIDQIHNTILALNRLDSDESKWSLTARSAVNWLHRLGFDYKEVRHGLYKDGHERTDVLIYRNDKFLPELEQLKPRLLEWNESGELIRTSAEIWATTGQSPVVMVTHDECTCHSNDGPKRQWVQKDSQPLRKKSLGKGIMLSGFLTPISTLRVPDHISDSYLHQHGIQREAMETIEFGGDSWWTSDKLVTQVIEQAIPIFELQFPGCQALFLFDNAPSHHAWPANALRAHSMNLTPGGEAPVMKDGWYFNNYGNLVIQHTNFPDGRPKGLKLLLEERGL